MIYLVRHGQSTWNVSGRIQGDVAHPPLTSVGEQQARAAGRCVARGVGGGPVVVCSSDLLRAQQTTAWVVAELAAAQLRPRVVFSRLLREQYLGAMQGKFPGQLRAEPTPVGQHISQVRWAGGESIADVYQRLAVWWGVSQKTVLSAQAATVVVGHGDSLRVLEAVLTGRSYREVEWTPWPNGAVRCVTPTR